MYDDAKLHCKEIAPKGTVGNLISITDSETLKVMKDLMTSGDHWTGGYLLGGNWHGVTDPNGASQIGLQMNQTTLEGLKTKFVFVLMGSLMTVLREKNLGHIMKKWQDHFTVNIQR